MLNRSLHGVKCHVLHLSYSKRTETKSIATVKVGWKLLVRICMVDMCSTEAFNHLQYATRYCNLVVRS